MDKIYSRKRLLIPKLRKKSKGSGITGTTSFNRISEGDLSKGSYFHGVGRKNIGGFKDKDLKKVFDRKLIKTAIIVIIAVCIANRIISTIEPTMDILCIDMAKSIATRVSNEQATNVMEKYKYEDISNIIRDEQGNIKMIQMNIAIVNSITSDVALRIQEGLENYKSDEFSIKLGTFTRYQNFIR